ncbi:hypothetical protein HDF26_001358 [Pedobacter cryoconitis]|nr:hypothetical protein [Pedobacter cryoconitis]
MIKIKQALNNDFYFYLITDLNMLILIIRLN